MDKYLIYPKQFQRANIPIDKNRCFVIMPFKKEMDAIYGSIKNRLGEAGYICNRVDEVSGSTPIVNKILTEILHSRYIIADLTELNANVFYELGIAHSFKDAQNIIILKQRGVKIPFDVTHLTYIEYTPDNLLYLNSAILKSILENSTFVDFQEALNLRGIVPYVKDNCDYFVDYLKSEMSDSLNLLTRVLLHEHDKLPEEEIQLLFLRYDNVFQKACKGGNREIIPGLIKIYQEIFIICSNYNVTQDYVSAIMGNRYFELYNFDTAETTSWQTDISIALASASKFLYIVLPWIIHYFSHTKTATIDLNRYKLEAFLMTNHHPTVDAAICNAVFDDNCYIREHISDIIGEKRLLLATENLKTQLQSEENYYSAVSEIEALGKLNAVEALTTILQWVEEHRLSIINEKQFFILKHVRIVLLKLDKTNSEIKKFDREYGKYLKDYYIL